MLDIFIPAECFSCVWLFKYLRKHQIVEVLFEIESPAARAGAVILNQQPADIAAVFIRKRDNIFVGQTFNYFKYSAEQPCARPVPISDQAEDVAPAEIIPSAFPAIPAFPLLSIPDEDIERFFMSIPDCKMNFVILDRLDIDQTSNLNFHASL
ncbi:hypothetical protein D3C80_1498720 [compost metagenome]